MPIANIQILKGRTKAERQLLIAMVTDAIVSSLGVKTPSVRVVLTEIDPENWGVGGVPKSARRPNETTPSGS